MTNKHQYEYKKFKSGKRKGEVYVNIRDVKTGKTIRTVSSKIGLQKAHKAVYQQKRRGKATKEKLDVIERMEGVGAGGTHKEYLKEYEKVYREMELKNKRGFYKFKNGKTCILTAAQLRGRAKKVTIQHKTGVACRYRYAWRYWHIIGTDDEGKVICDSTPVFTAGKLYREGSEDYPYMKEICMDIWNSIQSGIKSDDICNVAPYKPQGGHCVVLYHKSGNKTHIKQNERGAGCGVSIDFKKE